MLRAMILVFTVIGFCAATAHADGKDFDKGGKIRPPRDVCFNLVCEYRAKRSHGDERCQAAATFTKKVSFDGRELWDDSGRGDNPAFEVECNEQVLFNGTAHRFTDEYGTRIQAEIGPYPAILLPKGSLEDTHRYVISSLELQGKRLDGYCYLYTGPQ